MTLTEFLAVSRLREIAPSLEDIRNVPGAWRGLSRVPFVPAEDGDIIANVSQRVTAGDILPDGARPLVKTSPAPSLDVLTVANFMRHSDLPPSQINLLARIVSNGGIPGEVESFGSWIGTKVRENRTGNLARCEQAVWGMFLDSFTYSYDGQSFTITWGKPSALKVTPLNLWTDSTNGVPITDVSTLTAYALDTYGITYNRMELPHTDFINMISTTQFQNLAKAAQAVNTLAPAANTQFYRDMAANLLGLEQVLVMGQTIDEEDMAATVTATKLLPDGKVLLSRTSDDNNTATWQFGNATVLQSLNAMILGERGGGSVVGGFSGVTRGPVAFAMGDLFRVGLYDVVRGFPMLKNKAATAVLTVR